MASKLQKTLFAEAQSAPAVEPLPAGPRPAAERLGRLDVDCALSESLLSLCRLQPGEVWEDPAHGHRVGVLDAASLEDVAKLAGGEKCALMLGDPPYNVAVGGANSPSIPKTGLNEYLRFSRAWVSNAIAILQPNAHFYCWIGADYRDGFQPLPDFMLLLREFPEIQPRNLITLRNQRGYGTQKNWMWVRQELLHYVRGNPRFKVVYTDIPKTLRGYYKEVNGELTENLERGKAGTIRPGNVWVDVQQVFYRMEENVPGCYAQKPLKAIERIIESSSRPGDLVVDLFAHSGTTLLAGERLGRRVYTGDRHPIFAELSIRRLERFRATGKTGWQWRNPFPETESGPGH